MFIGEGNGNPLHILAWEIPCTEKPGGLQSMGSQRVGHDLETKQQIYLTSQIKIIAAMKLKDTCSLEEKL